MTTTASVQTPITTQVAYYIHYVPEKDWAKAIGFFQSTLGLALRYDTGHGWAELDAGGKLTFALHTGENLHPKNTGICFQVEDCDVAVDQLRARGVEGVTEPKKVTEEPGASRCFSFKDPFGNTFYGDGK